MKKKIIIYTTILLLLDIISKTIIKINFNLHETFEIINNFFSITYVINHGAAFGIFENQQLFLIVLAIILMILFVKNILKEKLNTYKVIYYSLLLSGIMGNLFDRIVYNGVIDFLDFKIFNYNFPVFNLADTFIVISVILIILENIWKDKNEN